MPTTPLPGPYIPQSQAGAGNFVGYNTGNQFPPQNPNFYTGYSSSSSSSNAGPTNPLTLDRSVSDMASAGTMSDGFNLVPNVDFDAWSESDSFFNQQAAGSNETENENAFKAHLKNSSDLIQLGFEGIMSSEEKEYFSLEYFDPLHRRGRTVSISTPNSTLTSSHYFFAKPPEDTDIVSKERDAWVTFDDGEFVVGGADNTDKHDAVSVGFKVDEHLPSAVDTAMDDVKVLIVFVYLLSVTVMFCNAEKYLS